MLLSIKHNVTYRYEPEPVRAALRLKLFPQPHLGQSPNWWTVTVNGAEVSQLLRDAAGDGVTLWHDHEGAADIAVDAVGQVTTTDTAGVLKDHRETMAPPVFLRQTDLTRPDEAIEEIAASVECLDGIDRLHALSDAVRSAITYRKGATEAETTAREAMARGAGVCQDQAHVFISAARIGGIPARYVVGYLIDPDGDAATEEGATHAWAEAHVKGLGWVGFDVTNELCPTDRYVRLSSGLDAYDAAPVRGTILGEAEEDMTVGVTVEEVAQSQSQQ